MSMDIHTELDPTPMLALSLLDANIDYDGGAVEVTDYESFEVVIWTSELLDGVFETKIYESDELDGLELKDATLIPEANLLGTYADLKLDASSSPVPADTIARVGVVFPSKKYISSRTTVTGVTSGGRLGVLCIRGNKHNEPTIGETPLA